MAAEEGGGEVLDGGEEVVFLSLAEGGLDRGALFAGEGFVEAADAAGGFGVDGPAEVDEGRGAALGTDEEGWIALLHVGIEPLEADVVAAAGGVEAHLGLLHGEAAQGVDAFDPGGGLALGFGAGALHGYGAREGARGDFFGGRKVTDGLAHRALLRGNGVGMKGQPRRLAAWRRRARAEARSLWPSSLRGAE